MKIAVIGVGSIGKEHARVAAETAGCELYGVVDTSSDRAQAVAEKNHTKYFSDLEMILGKVDAAVIAVPTDRHRQVTTRLLEAGIDCLLEKPIAGTLSDADSLIETAAKHGRLLQIGHLERFNPALQAAQRIINQPRFIEIHRLGSFVPRSLDIDVVLDLMIHDIDIVLTLVGEMPMDVRAVGVPILTKRIDICNARMEFSKCVANVTASRVYRDKVRKVRIFQNDAYISLDYKAQAGEVYRLVHGKELPGISAGRLEVVREEPLKLQLRAFLEAVSIRRVTSCTAEQARRALQIALEIVERAQKSL